MNTKAGTLAHYVRFPSVYNTCAAQCIQAAAISCSKQGVVSFITFQPFADELIAQRSPPGPYRSLIAKHLATRTHVPLLRVSRRFPRMVLVMVMFLFYHRRW